MRRPGDISVRKGRCGVAAALLCVLGGTLMIARREWMQWHRRYEAVRNHQSEGQRQRILRRKIGLAAGGGVKRVIVTRREVEKQLPLVSCLPGCVLRWWCCDGLY